jgi:hypothetical protein
MFSLDTGSGQKHPSTNDQEPIYLDADADDVVVLFDMLALPAGNQWSSIFLHFPVKQCVTLTALAVTYSFRRVNVIVERILNQHLAVSPIHVLEEASTLQELLLGRRALHCVSVRSKTCGGYTCECGPFWRDFNGVSRAWRAELAFCVMNITSLPIVGGRRHDGSQASIACSVLREVAVVFNPG